MSRDSDPRLRDLQDSGFLLPPVLSTEDIRRVLRLQTVSAVLRMRLRDGLPLARVGRRYLVSRQLFQRWLDERATEQLAAGEEVG